MFVILGIYGRFIQTVHINAWASDRRKPGDYELMTTFVNQQMQVELDWDTEDNFDIAYKAFKNSPS